MSSSSNGSRDPFADCESLSEVAEKMARVQYQKVTTNLVDEGLARYLLSRCGWDQETIERQIRTHHRRLILVHEAAATAIVNMSVHDPLRIYAQVIAGIEPANPEAFAQIAGETWAGSDTDGETSSDRNMILEAIGRQFLCLHHVTRPRKPEPDPDDAPNVLDEIEVRSTFTGEVLAKAPAA